MLRIAKTHPKTHPWVVLSLVLMAASQFGDASAAGGRWQLTFSPSTLLRADQFEEDCAANSATGVPGNPPPKLQRWNTAANAWEISLDRAHILAGYPNCDPATTHYIYSQVDSYSPLSQTLLTQLYQQGSYRVMTPTRRLNFNGVAISHSFWNTATTNVFNMGYQSGEADVIKADGSVDFGQYKVQGAFLGLVATADPTANQLLNGSDGQRRINCYYVDYSQGTSWVELNSQIPASQAEVYFTAPHNYSIAWEAKGRPGTLGYDNTRFDVVYSIDGNEVCRYRNNTTSTSNYTLADYLLRAQGVDEATVAAYHVGQDQRLVAKRRTVPKATQGLFGISNSDAGNVAAGNAPIPTIPVSATLRSMSIEDICPLACLSGQPSSKAALTGG